MTIDQLNAAADIDEAGEEQTDAALGTPAKKTNPTLLVMLGVAAIGGGALFLMNSRAGVASASAASIETESAQATIDGFLAGGSKNIRAMEDAIANTEGVVKQFLAYPSSNQVPLDGLASNPFRHAKAVGQPLDNEADRKKREETRQVVLKSVQNLQLQSMLIGGDRRACMINNAMYREGQSVDGFTIEKISQSGVILRQDVYRFELKMQQ